MLGRPSEGLDGLVHPGVCPWEGPLQEQALPRLPSRRAVHPEHPRARDTRAYADRLLQLERPGPLEHHSRLSGGIPGDQPNALVPRPMARRVPWHPRAPAHQLGDHAPGLGFGRVREAQGRQGHARPCVLARGGGRGGVHEGLALAPGEPRVPHVEPRPLRAANPRLRSAADGPGVRGLRRLVGRPPRGGRHDPAGLALALAHGRQRRRAHAHGHRGVLGRGQRGQRGAASRDCRGGRQRRAQQQRCGLEGGRHQARPAVEALPAPHRLQRLPGRGHGHGLRWRSMRRRGESQPPVPGGAGGGRRAAVFW
mmetsp:Transcript_69092/g.167073  ORF Transcript_69092/g.167073 Transcript_69092/m.167073 type:complete len:310 (+) Transcript_69092:99-1028(+)